MLAFLLPLLKPLGSLASKYALYLMLAAAALGVYGYWHHEITAHARAAIYAQLEKSDAAEHNRRVKSLEKTQADINRRMEIIHAHEHVQAQQATDLRDTANRLRGAGCLDDDSVRRLNELGHQGSDRTQEPAGEAAD